MTDGYWKIKQYAPTAKSGFTVTEIPVARFQRGDVVLYGDEPDPHIEPRAWEAHNSLIFKWADGRKEHYPWASIVHAEYQPPTNPQERGT